jgi:nucleoside 2-deoxyribosyltransferase
MEQPRQKIYCAGPLFTCKEQDEMREIALALEAAGYATFLPQRDGLELTECIDLLSHSRMSRGEAGGMMSRAIFALDIYQVLYGCRALVANLNGRVPDEGTVAEAAMAWSRGKPVIGYKADSRTVFGGHDNPLLAGLFDFQLCRNIPQIVESVRNALLNADLAENPAPVREEEIDKYATVGGEISTALEQRRPLPEVVEVILKFAELIGGICPTPS